MSVSDDDLPVGKRHGLRMARARLLVRLGRAGRLTNRLLGTPRLSIFGCYDTGNVGDLALGQTLARLAQPLASTAFESPATARYLSPADAVVLAGGGVINARRGGPLAVFSEHVARRRCAVGIVGVSGELKRAELPDATLRMLQGAAYVSVRSQASRTQLAQALGRDDIVVQPDIAFALRRAFAEELAAERPRTDKLLAVNVSPFLHTLGGRHFTANQRPSRWFSEHLPDEAGWYDRIAPAYVTLVRQLLAVQMARGWRVELVPLAPEDDVFARALLAGLPVRFAPYSPDPIRAYRRFARASRALVTRFHAHVFCLLAGTPLQSLAYSGKCSDLFSDLSLERDEQADPKQWVHEAQPTLERLLARAEGAVLQAPEREALEARAAQACLDGLKSVLSRSGA